MDMVDRIMRAFIRKQPLTAAQEEVVRAEIAAFAHGLLVDDKDALAERQAPIHKGD